MSNIIDFYSSVAPNVEGDFYSQIMSFSDFALELNHSYIQWLFPLQEPSNFNPDAPILTEEDIQLFKCDPKLKEKLMDAFVRFLQFLKLDSNFNRLENFNELVFTQPNHNWLRITRILRSLTILGLAEEAKKFHDFLITNNYGSLNSQQYWEEAVYE